VAATNRDLRVEAATGKFREDLYFRLAVIPVHLPSLRERRQDILPLACHFLAKWNAELSRDLCGWTPEVEAYLLKHNWPGNVRELENTIERGVVLARNERITLDDLLIDAGSDSVVNETDGGTGDLQSFLDQAAAERIRAVLTEVHGARLEAARRLGIDRTTLYRLIRKYQL
jgi:DNA-binding NtrC family response regulator